MHVRMYTQHSTLLLLSICGYCTSGILKVIDTVPFSGSCTGPVVFI